MKYKFIVGTVLFSLMVSNAMAQMRRTVSQWPVAPFTSLRVYATSCEGSGGYGWVSNEGAIRWSPLLYQLSLNNSTGATLIFHCIVNQE